MPALTFTLSVMQDDLLLAYQLCFDLFENESQAFNLKVSHCSCTFVPLEMKAQPLCVCLSCCLTILLSSSSCVCGCRGGRLLSCGLPSHPPCR